MSTVTINRRPRKPAGRQRWTNRWKGGFGRLKHEWGILPLRVRRLPPRSSSMWT
jgi:hypothetical protein